MDGPEFFRRAARVTAYGGVMAIRIEEIRAEAGELDEDEAGDPDDPDNLESLSDLSDLADLVEVR